MKIVFTFIHESSFIHSDGPMDVERNVIGYIGHPMSLDCDISANPDVEFFQWIAHGDILPDEQNKILHIVTLSDSDVGQYECIASNVINGENRTGVLSLELEDGSELYSHVCFLKQLFKVD